MKANEPAHPIGAVASYTGLTIRDYIAIEAMKSFIPIFNMYDIDEIAKHSYKMADEMIKQSEEK